MAVVPCECFVGDAADVAHPSVVDDGVAVCVSPFAAFEPRNLVDRRVRRHRSRVLLRVGIGRVRQELATSRIAAHSGLAPEQCDMARPGQRQQQFVHHGRRSERDSAHLLAAAVVAYVLDCAMARVHVGDCCAEHQFFAECQVCHQVLPCFGSSALNPTAIVESIGFHAPSTERSTPSPVTMSV